MKKLISILLTTALSLVSTSLSAEVIISHKTAGLEYPENTLEGFEASLRMPVDAIELDLHVTADKQLILHHDPVLSSYNCFTKNDDQRLILAQKTLNELMALKCHNHKVDADYTLPSFDQILQAYSESDQSKELYIEIKVWDELIENNPLHKGLDTARMHFPDDQVAVLLLNAVRSYGLTDKVVFNSFSRNLLLELKALQTSEEQFRYGLLYKGSYSPWTLGIIALFTPLQCYDSCWAPDYTEVSQWVTENQIDFLIPNFAQLNNFLFRRGYKREINDRNTAYDVIPWTLNSKDDWQKYQSYRFAGIITDKPSAYTSK